MVDRIVPEHPDAADEAEAFCRRVRDVLRRELGRRAGREPVSLVAERPRRFS